MPSNRRPLSRRCAVLITVGVILAGLLAYTFIEPFWIQVKHYTYSSTDVPAAFDDTRIVFLTDIHRGPFFSEDRVRRLVDRVNTMAPDIIMLGGDYASDGEDEASCLAQLTHLRAPLGRYAVLGNHDYEKIEYTDQTYVYDVYDPSPAIDAIERAGLELLDNRGVWVERNGHRIRVGGVSDHRVGSPRLSPIVGGTTAEDLVILLSHNPDYAEHIPQDYVDLVLSGHTHGGQVSFFGFYAPYLPSENGQKYRSGMVHNGSTTVIVSNGVGSYLPIRFFARPQIVVITLKSASESD
ncbi:MAG: metallophosphoesterase [Thermoleophilia bacterium]|jgi:predicted MPP superfamily phosphohydrolase